MSCGHLRKERRKKRVHMFFRAEGNY